MLGRRIDVRSAIDGLLLAVPTVMMYVATPEVVRIAFYWSDEHPEARISAISPVSLIVMGFILFVALPFVVASARFLCYPPLRVTPARLLVSLAATLLAIALAVIDMIYNG